MIRNASKNHKNLYSCIIPAGQLTRSFGDGKQRKYDFTYDAANRLIRADFYQYDGSVFNKTENINFSVSNLTFDGNGNILSMHQQGLKVNTSPMIDQLTYTYFTGTNSLQKVVDGVTANNKLGDFNYGTNGAGADYNYDPNGNLTLDNNKAISSIVYSRRRIVGKGNAHFGSIEKTVICSC
jgi:hypothetical protein